MRGKWQRKEGKEGESGGIRSYKKKKKEPGQVVIHNSQSDTLECYKTSTLMAPSLTKALREPI